MFLSGLGYVGTLSPLDGLKYFFCGIQDPTTTEGAPWCNDFWMKMAGVQPPASIIPGPSVPPQALTDPSGYDMPMPTIDPRGNINTFFQALPDTPSPTNWLLWAGLGLSAIVGVKLLSRYL